MLPGHLRTIFRAATKAGQEGFRLHQAVLRLLRRAGRPGSLLDVGCREGAKARLYASELSIPLEKVAGLEGQEEHCRAASGSIRAVCLDLEKEKFPFADESYELVICNQVLEHLKNIFLPLSEMDRVVKTGGYLLLGIPNLAALHNRLLMLAGVQPVCNQITGPHVRCFTHSAFIKFLRTNPNFELVASAGSTLYPFPYPLVDLLGRAFPGLSSFTVYLLRKKKHDPGACAWNLQSLGDTLLG